VGSKFDIDEIDADPMSTHFAGRWVRNQTYFGRLNDRYVLHVCIISRGRVHTNFSTYLLTSAVELLNDARQCRMQDKTLNMHTYKPCECERMLEIS